MKKNFFILNFFMLYNMLWKLSLIFLKKNNNLNKEFKKRTTSIHHKKADIWIHAASAGEAYLAISILNRLKTRKKLKILLTSITLQGFNILQTQSNSTTLNEFFEITIEYFPFDMPDNIKQAVKIIDPCLMILLETELWPALLYFLKQNQTKILIINARLSAKSFKKYKLVSFIAKHFSPDLILATSEKYKKRFAKIFYNSKIKLMQNIKFESFETINSKIADVNINNPNNLPITVFASIIKNEETDIIKILKLILNDFPDQIIAIFPRHQSRIQAWEKHLTSNKFKYLLRSKLSPNTKDDKPNNLPLNKSQIILWDKFGEQNSFFKLSSIVFVGGSLKPLGGQNFIEPAINGCFTIIGPYYDDFDWVKEDIFKDNIVTKKQDWKEVAYTIVNACKNPESPEKQKKKTIKYVEKNKGGTDKACTEILKYF